MLYLTDQSLRPQIKQSHQAHTFIPLPSPPDSRTHRVKGIDDDDDDDNDDDDGGGSGGDTGNGDDDDDEEEEENDYDDDDDDNDNDDDDDDDMTSLACGHWLALIIRSTSSSQGMSPWWR